MKHGLMLAFLLLPLTLRAESVPENDTATAGDPRLRAPGTLSGYAPESREKPPAQPTMPPSVLSAPPVLRFHEERQNPPRGTFPQLGRTPGQGNPWERPDDRRGSPTEAPPPPPRPLTPMNPWSLDEQLLSAPGIPGMDRSLPLAPMDPLLSPMPYAPMPGTSYGLYPPLDGNLPGGMPLYPYEGGLTPGYGTDRSRFPFSPMDWF